MADAATLLDYELIQTIDGVQQYDVYNNAVVSQLFVPVGIQEGDTFKMHYGFNLTADVTWKGSLEQSVDDWIDEAIRAHF